MLRSGGFITSENQDLRMYIYYLQGAQLSVVNGEIFLQIAHRVSLIKVSCNKAKQGFKARSQYKS